MIDIHTHILPCIDDGASSLQEAIELLLAEKQQGITGVVFTPHFVLQDKSLNNFIEERNAAFNLLKKEIEKTGLCQDMEFYLGAEVRYDPNLIKEDLFALCIEGTSYLLLEPLNVYPYNFEKTLDAILSMGITPIIAHVERFNYLIKDEKLLSRLLNNGVVFQSNAHAVLSRKFGSKNAKKLIKRGIVQVIASDTHNLECRPPMLKEAFKKLSKHESYLKRNAQRIVSDKLI